jgi:hypothetical protein
MQGFLKVTTRRRLLLNNSKQAIPDRFRDRDVDKMSDIAQFYLNFLRDNQPMPSDEYLSEDDIRIIDDAREFFMQNPDKLCIPLRILG